MSDIEHSHWVTVCSLCLRPISAANLGHADDCDNERQGYELAQVAYVPSAALRGAVGLLHELRSALMAHIDARDAANLGDTDLVDRIDVILEAADS